MGYYISNYQLKELVAFICRRDWEGAMGLLTHIRKTQELVEGQILDSQVYLPQITLDEIQGRLKELIDAG